MLKTQAGKTLRDARDAAGLSQFELAVRAGVSVATISDLETGRNKTPRRRTLNAICAPLPRLSVEDLLEAAVGAEAAS